MWVRATLVVSRVEMQAGVEAGHQPRLEDNQVESLFSGHVNPFDTNGFKRKRWVKSENVLPLIIQLRTSQT